LNSLFLPLEGRKEVSECVSEITGRSAENARLHRANLGMGAGECNRMLKVTLKWQVARVTWQKCVHFSLSASVSQDTIEKRKGC